MEVRTEKIDLRATKTQKKLIDRAAHRLGKNRTDFMLEAACREAQDSLLDQNHFVLSDEKFKAFMAVIDQPPRDNPALRRLLETKPPWER
jgi:uncharacterized protein (DUF1778 family)